MFPCMSQRLRIGHVTDLHLRHHLAGTSAVAARRSRQMPALFEEALALFAAREVDVVAVTGDLVDHPLDGEQSDDVLRDGEADLRLVADLIAAGPQPALALPGNHDHPDLFDGVFDEHPRDIDVQGTRVLAFHDMDRPRPGCEPRPTDPPVNVPRRDGAERARFEALARDGDARPQVHLQHYVITPRLDEGWPHTYVDGEALREGIVADGRTRLCLSGHYHPGVEPHRVGETWFAVGAAFCQVPHPVYVYELAADGDLRSERIDLRPGDGTSGGRA
jgi:3',5'-cyclic AMP phosphodiesterase CpdA